MFDLHALADDLTLHALGDTKRGAEEVPVLHLERLTAPNGDYLVDPSGNYLVAQVLSNYAFPMILNSLQDDLNLTAYNFSHVLHALPTEGIQHG